MQSGFSSPSLVILTGAGISAESGLATFRAADGLWEGHRVEEVASPEGFEKNPELVLNFYNARRAQLSEGTVGPNAAHFALTKLEQEWPGKFLLVTQNIDDLHQRAGSKQLVHMHGELNKARCSQSGQVLDWLDAINLGTACNCCDPAHQLRPHVVWFGEVPLGLEDIYASLANCDVFLAIGTSGWVYPAAGFVGCLPRGSLTIEVNLSSTQTSPAFREHYVGPASEKVPEVVKRLLSGRDFR